MSAEMLTAVASIATVVVIAATGVAALIQLRHMRASNAIEAILSFRSIIEDEQHRNATAILRTGDLERAMTEPEFRRYLYRRMKRLPTGDVPPHYVELMDAAIAMGNCFELIGTMIRSRVVPPEIVLPNYWWIIVGTWDRTSTWVETMRQYSGSDGMYVDFEFLTVISQRWGEAHPDSYAQGYPRMPKPATYPLLEESWALEVGAEPQSRH